MIDEWWSPPCGHGFTLEGLRAAVGSRCAVRLNDTTQEVDGLPPYSVEVTTPEGQDEQRLAETLARAIPLGFVTLGDVELPVMIDGRQCLVRFRRAAGRGT